jgi:hypothetical protein
MNPAHEIVTIEVYELCFECTVNFSTDGDGISSWEDYECIAVDLLPFDGPFQVERWPTYEHICEEACQKAHEVRTERRKEG